MSALVAYARTVNDEEDFFETYIGRQEGPSSSTPEMKGNERTRLMCGYGGDITDSFP